MFNFRRFDQFKLIHLFMAITGIAFLLAVVRMLMLAGLLSRQGLFMFGGFSILATMAYLLADHEMRIHFGERRQFGRPSIVLFFVLGGLAGLFLWLLGNGMLTGL